MPTVLLSPVGLDRGFWRFGDLLEVPGAVAHELPGFGARARAEAQPTMATLADEIVALHSGPLDLVGVSMGGMVAQHVCIRHPDRVRSALVACTGAWADPATMAARAAAAEAGGMQSLLEPTLERWFTRLALADRDRHAGVRYASQTLLGLDPGAFADGWRTIATHDARPGLPAVTARLTVVAGSEDVAAPAARCAEIAELVPRARLLTMRGPHMLPLENGYEFAAVVREHLAVS